MRHQLLVSLALILTAVPAAAVTKNTDRILRNVELAVSNVKVNDAYAKAAVPEREHQTAVNLLRDVDYAIKRASDLSNVSPEDKGDVQVKALTQKLDSLAEYREKLAQNLKASENASSALNDQYRSFREDAKPYGKELALFPNASGSSQQHVGNVSGEALTGALKKLAELDQICKSKYPSIPFDDHLSFQLAINPLAVCNTAAKRRDLAATMVKDIVTTDLTRLLSWIDESRTKLASSGGVLAPPGAVDDLIYRRPKAKEALLARHKPLFDAVGAAMPPDLLAPFDTAVAALWAEVDRLAPTYTFDTKVFHDNKAEAGAKKALAAFKPAAKVQKLAVLYPDWDIAKNDLGIPTERYRTGAVLYKDADSQWCQYRSFTAHADYAGGGTYASTFKYTFGGIRYQQCK